jgi:hypothetical protein
MPFPPPLSVLPASQPVPPSIEIARGGFNFLVAASHISLNMHHLVHLSKIFFSQRTLLQSITLTSDFASSRLFSATVLSYFIDQKIKHCRCINSMVVFQGTPDFPNLSPCMPCELVDQDVLITINIEVAGQ